MRDSWENADQWTCQVETMTSWIETRVFFVAVQTAPILGALRLRGESHERTTRGLSQKHGSGETVVQAHEHGASIRRPPLQCYTMPTYRGPGTRMSSCKGSPRMKPAQSRRFCPSRSDAPRFNRVPGGRRGSIRVFEFDSWTAGMPSHGRGSCGWDRLRYSPAFGYNTRRLPGAFGTASEISPAKRHIPAGTPTSAGL